MANNEAAKAPAPVKEAPAELAATKVVPSEKIREAVKAQDEDLATVLAAKMKAAEKEAEKEAAKVAEDETIVVKKVQAAVAEETTAAVTAAEEMTAATDAAATERAADAETTEGTTSLRREITTRSSENPNRSCRSSIRQR